MYISAEFDRKFHNINSDNRSRKSTLSVIATDRVNKTAAYYVSVSNNEIIDEIILIRRTLVLYLYPSLGYYHET